MPALTYPTVHDLNVSDPWFSAISAGKKTVEGRLAKGKFVDIRVGDVLRISLNSNNNSYSTRVVQDIKKYDGFKQYLEQEGLARTLPGVGSIRDGVKIYREFYSPRTEKQFGVVALHLKSSCDANTKKTRHSQ